MSQYTLTIQQLIKGDCKIFDFNYPTVNEEYKEYFESNFIDYFMLDEIGHETVGQFKLALKRKLNLIMPYYNKIIETQLMEQRILDNYDVTESFTRNVDGTTSQKGNTKYNSSNNSVDRNLYKDTPKTKIDIDKFDYVTNISKNINDNSNNSNSDSVQDVTSTNIEKWERKMQGNIGIQTDADAIIKYWESVRNVTLEIFENELTSLFMGIF